jgi:hypothetical protein
MANEEGLCETVTAAQRYSMEYYYADADANANANAVLPTIQDEE